MRSLTRLSVRSVGVLLACVGSPALACPHPDYMDLPWVAEVTLFPSYGLDPFTMSVKAEGTAPLRDCGLEGQGLAGYDGNGLVDVRLAAVLQWRGGGERLAITTEFEEDTLLLVRDPDSGWHFDDNGREHNPLVVLPNPQAGTYAIYIGTHPGAVYTRPGTLLITQTGP